MEREPEQSMDLRGTPCPMNWVKANIWAGPETRHFIGFTPIHLNF